MAFSPRHGRAATVLPVRIRAKTRLSHLPNEIISKIVSDVFDQSSLDECLNLRLIDRRFAAIIFAKLFQEGELFSIDFGTKIQDAMSKMSRNQSVNPIFIEAYWTAFLAREHPHLRSRSRRVWRNLDSALTIFQKEYSDVKRSVRCGESSCLCRRKHASTSVFKAVVAFLEATTFDLLFTHSRSDKTPTFVGQRPIDLSTRSANFWVAITAIHGHNMKLLKQQVQMLKVDCSQYLTELDQYRSLSEVFADVWPCAQSHWVENLFLCLYMAIEQGFGKAIPYLLDQLPIITSSRAFQHLSIFGNTILDIAIEEGDVQLFHMLLARGWLFSFDGSCYEILYINALQALAARPDTCPYRDEMAIVLFDKSGLWQLPQIVEGILFHCARRNDLRLINIMLAMWPTITEDGRADLRWPWIGPACSPISDAFHFRHVDFVRFILENRPRLYRSFRVPAFDERRWFIVQYIRGQLEHIEINDIELVLQHSQDLHLHYEFEEAAMTLDEETFKVFVRTIDLSREVYREAVSQSPFAGTQDAWTTKTSYTIGQMGLCAALRALHVPNVRILAEQSQVQLPAGTAVQACVVEEDDHERVELLRQVEEIMNKQGASVKKKVLFTVNFSKPGSDTSDTRPILPDDVVVDRGPNDEISSGTVVS